MINKKYSWNNNFRRKKLALSPKVEIDKLIERGKYIFRNTGS